MLKINKDMQLLNELKYNVNDFNNIDLGDLIVVFKGYVNIIHVNDITDSEYKKIFYLLQELCKYYNNMYPIIFNDDNTIRDIYTKNDFSNISSAILQFAGFPKILIGEVDEEEDGWTLIIDNDYYDIVNSKELQQLLKTNILSDRFNSLMINDKKYDISYLNGLKNDNSKNIPLANPLYHGTTEKFLYSILTKGLRKIQDNSLFKANNDGYVFLTSDYNIANDYARMYSQHYKSNQVVLEINSNLIDKNKIVLDYDFINSFGKSSEKNFYDGKDIKDYKNHKGDIASYNGSYGTKFTKIGYKGIVMPNAIENVYIIQNGKTIKKTKEEYISSLKMNNENINESWKPETYNSLPQKIKLYHGTDFEGLTEILETKVIDASKGRQTGETHGMNWFFIKNNNSFSRGFMFSIEVDKSDFENGNFHFMNNVTVACYKPINIVNHNFFIEEAFGLKFEDLKNLLHTCIEKENNDFSEGYFKFYRLLSNDDYYGYTTIDDVIIIQLMRQLGYKDSVLRDELGIIENVKHINEVSSSEVNLKSFAIKSDLHPKLWVNDKLNSRVRLRLLEIADDFIDTLSVDWVKPKDVVFTGSLANYNWSKYSDIDLHVVLDYNKVYKKTEFVEDYFNAKKEMWLNEHPNLKIYGFPVEMYVEDSNSENSSTGVYSLYKNKWLKEPGDFQNAKLNEKYIKETAANLMTKIDKIEKRQKSTNDEHKIEMCQKELKKIFDNLKKIRKESLDKQGEMGSGNIIYKILRRTNYIDKIWDLINSSYDKINSITESKKRIIYENISETETFTDEQLEMIPEDSGMKEKPEIYSGVDYNYYPYFGDCRNTVDKDHMWDASQMSYFIYGCKLINVNRVVGTICNGDRKIPKILLNHLQLLKNQNKLNNLSEVCAGIDTYQRIMFIYLSSTDIHYFFDCK